MLMTQSRRYAGLALSLWLGLQSVALAGVFPLQSIDFASRGNGDMGITLNTGSIVPYHKVLVSDSKLVLDIDQVNAEERVRTNFAGAPNISHVIIQPLSKDKIRLIIRGKQLNSFQVAFSNPGQTMPGGLSHEESAWLNEAKSAMNDLQEGGMQSAVYTPDESDTADLQPVADTKPAKKADTATQVSDDLNAPPDDAAESLDTPIATLAHAEETGLKTKPLTESGMMDEGSDLLGNTNALEGATDAEQAWKNLLPGGINLDMLFKGGLLLTLLLGLGVFLHRKMNSLSSQTPTLEDMLAENAKSDTPKVGFREMATAYRAERAQQEEPAPRQNASRPGVQKNQKDQKEPIGLGSLRRQPEPTAPQVQPPTPQRPEFQPEPQALQTPPPARQALNQYQRQQVPGTAPKAKAAPKAPTQKQAPQARTESDAKLLDELIRARENQQQVRSKAAQAQQAQRAPQAPPQKPVNQAKAAKKPGLSMPNWPQASKHEAIRNTAAPKRPVVTHPHQQQPQQPLPENPEVLNFLRNVADLMEKDGKGNLARGIQKNLNPS